MATKLLKVKDKPTVYQVDEETQVASPFLGTKAFTEQGYTYGDIQEVSPEAFSPYKLGQPFGSQFVKTAESPSVFQIQGGERRPIKSEAAFEKLTGGKDWSQVATIGPELMAGYKMGDIIDIGVAETKKAGKEFTEIQKAAVAPPTPGLPAPPTIEEKETARPGIFSRMAEAIKGKPKAVAEARTEAAETYGLSEKEAAVSGILESAAKTKTKYMEALEANRRKPISAHLIQGREGILNRQMSIELQGLAALADIAQGDVLSAQSKIDQSVNDAIAVEQANLDALKVEMESTELSDMEKMRLDFMFSERARNLEREQELADQKKQLQLTLLQNGIQTSSTETFDQMASKLSQIYSREEERNLMAQMGMVYDPFEKKYVTTAAQEMAEEELALNKARLALSREQALGNITNFETLMAELALRQELLGDDLTPEDIETQKEAILNDPNLTPEEKRKGITDLDKTKGVLEKGEKQRAKAFRKKWLDIIGGAAGGEVILETIKAGKKVAEKITENEEGFFYRLFSR